MSPGQATLPREGLDRAQDPRLQPHRPRHQGHGGDARILRGRARLPAGARGPRRDRRQGPPEALLLRRRERSAHGLHERRGRERLPEGLRRGHQQGPRPRAGRLPLRLRRRVGGRSRAHQAAPECRTAWRCAVPSTTRAGRSRSTSAIRTACSSRSATCCARSSPTTRSRASASAWRAGARRSRRRRSRRRAQRGQPSPARPKTCPRTACSRASARSSRSSPSAPPTPSCSASPTTT